MMTEAEDPLISDFARRLRDRKLFKCVDVRERLTEEVRSEMTKKRRRKVRPRGAKPVSEVPAAPTTVDSDQIQRDVLDQASKEVERQVRLWVEENSVDRPRILVDRAERSLYKSFEESKGPLEQIMIRAGSEGTKPVDVASISQVVKAIAPLKVLRVYFQEGDEKAKLLIDRIIHKEARTCRQSMT